MTLYLILDQMAGATDAWVEVGEVEASGDRAAIAKAVKQEKLQTPSTMVAVPARSFKRRPVSFQTKISFVGGQAEPDSPLVEEPRPEPEPEEERIVGAAS